MTWKRLITLYNQEHAQFVNMTLPTEMKDIAENQISSSVRFRWTQIEHVTNDLYWSIDNIRLE